MKTIVINIATQFTATPGARHKSDGPFSGEEFRENFLETYFKETKDDTVLEIILDGVEGYATSFLEEAFGGLARRYGQERCFRKLKFVSKEDNLLLDEIKSYIDKCNE